MWTVVKPLLDLASLDLSVPSTGGNSFITEICYRFLDVADPPWLPSLTWVRALAALDIPAPTARSSLRRMTLAGYLVKEVRGAVVGHGMSQAWRRLMFDLPEPVGRPDDRWMVVVFNVPEAQRDLRHKLRTMLSRSRCAGLGNGVWVGRASVGPRLIEVLNRTGLGEYVHVFYADYAGPAGVDALVANGWDIGELERQYSEVLALVSDARTANPSGEEAFAQVVRASNALRMTQDDDPHLPREALPASWPADQAAAAVALLVRDRLPAAREWLFSNSRSAGS